MFRGSLIFLLLIAFLDAKDFNFEVKANKTHLLIGEELKLSYIFKYKSNIKIAEINFTPPEFKNFYIKQRKDLNSTNKENFTILKKNFILTASKELNTTIQPASIDVAILKNTNKEVGEYDDFDYDFKTFQTKKLTIKVSSFSPKTKLLGDFNITSFVDKKELNKNSPVNLTIKINGKGNIENIKSFKFNIKQTTIYQNKPIFSNNSFIQKFAILSNQDFTIPSFSITYFNNTKNKLITKKTLPIDIKIINKQKKTTLKENNLKFSYIYLLLSLFIGIIIGLFLNKVLKIFKKPLDLDASLLEKVKKAKNTKEVLKYLFAYSDIKQIQQLISEIENDIYKNKKNKLSTKNIYTRLTHLYNNMPK